MVNQIFVQDLICKLLKQITSQEFLPGSYQLNLDFSEFSSGIYFVRSESQKILLIKE
jgi:hypothetical protein